jgi:TrmH family RNA methyltransferase
MTTGRPSTVLASPSNPRVKAAAALRDRRRREDLGLTLVDGARELRRALDADVDVVELFACEAMLAGSDARMVMDDASTRGLTVTPVTEAAFGKIAFGSRTDGLVAVVRSPAHDLEGLRLVGAPMVVVVDGVEKPGNLGAVLRSADGAGADAVIAAAPGTDLMNPNVIRASAGTVFSIPTAAASTDQVVQWLTERRVRILTARVDAERTYTDVDLTGPIAFVLGAEDRGLGDAWAIDQAEPIRLPMLGVADSLNVSVAAAVLLYEARRQRDRHATGG